MKNINLVDSYMNPAQFRFFTTDWSPNGTSDLIIVDDMNQIIGSIDEALFGPTLDHNGHGETFGGVHICIDPESVMFRENSEEDDINPDDVVYPLTLDRVLSSIAVSPVQSNIDVLRKIVTVIKGV